MVYCILSNPSLFVKAMKRDKACAQYSRCAHPTVFVDSSDDTRSHHHLFLRTVWLIIINDSSPAK